MRNLRLVIKTDSYAGNFERELVGFVFGRLSEEQEEAKYGREYVKAFWNNYGNIDSYEQYILKKEKDDEFIKLMNTANFLLGKKEVKLEDSLNILDVYDEYLEFNREMSDDDYETTYYDINDKDVIVYFKKELPDEVMSNFIKRIKIFFENNVLSIFENYIYLCQFGNLSSTKEVKLLGIELEKDGKTVKRYE